MHAQDANTQDHEHEAIRRVVSDEDWKQRVKAEDAALDQKFKVESEQGRAASAPDTAEEPPVDTIDPAAIPSASFSTLVNMFTTQAMVALGFLPNPATGKAEAVPPLARHFIDLLGVLDDKTQGNLDEGERRLLDSSLHELRMAYVEVSRRAAQQADG